MRNLRQILWFFVDVTSQFPQSQNALRCPLNERETKFKSFALDFVFLPKRDRNPHSVAHCLPHYICPCAMLYMCAERFVTSGKVCWRNEIQLLSTSAFSLTSLNFPKSCDKIDPLTKMCSNSQSKVLIRCRCIIHTLIPFYVVCETAVSVVHCNFRRSRARTSPKKTITQTS